MSLDWVGQEEESSEVSGPLVHRDGIILSGSGDLTGRKGMGSKEGGLGMGQKGAEVGELGGTHS